MKQSPSPPTQIRFRNSKISPQPGGIKVGRLLEKKSDDTEEKKSSSVTSESLNEKASTEAQLPPNRKRISKRTSHNSNDIQEYQAE